MKKFLSYLFVAGIALVIGFFLGAKSPSYASQKDWETVMKDFNLLSYRAEKVSENFSLHCYFEDSDTFIVSGTLDSIESCHVKLIPKLKKLKGGYFLYLDSKRYLIKLKEDSLIFPRQIEVDGFVFYPCI